jgi:hypothetical protein
MQVAQSVFDQLFGEWAVLGVQQLMLWQVTVAVGNSTLHRVQQHDPRVLLVLLHIIGYLLCCFSRWMSCDVGTLHHNNQRHALTEREQAS